MCTFANGTSCEEWALFRNEGCKAGVTAAVTTTTNVSTVTANTTSASPATNVSGVTAAATTTASK